MPRHNWDAIFEPSQPKVGIRHFDAGAFKSPIERAREDDPARVKAIEQALARIQRKKGQAEDQRPEALHA